MKIDPELVAHLRSRIGTIGEATLAEKIRQRQRQESFEDTTRLLKEKVKEEYLTPEDRAGIKLKEAQAKYYEGGGGGFFFYDNAGNTYDAQGNPVENPEIGRKTILRKIKETPAGAGGAGSGFEFSPQGVTSAAIKLLSNKLKGVPPGRFAEGAIQAMPQASAYSDIAKIIGSFIRKKNEPASPVAIPQTGQFTGGRTVATPEVPAEITAKYPDAYRGEDGQWYVDRGGKTYRLKIE